MIEKPGNKCRILGARQAWRMAAFGHFGQRDHAGMAQHAGGALLGQDIRTRPPDQMHGQIKRVELRPVLHLLLEPGKGGDDGRIVMQRPAPVAAPPHEHLACLRAQGAGNNHWWHTGSREQRRRGGEEERAADGAEGGDARR